MHFLVFVNYLISGNYTHRMTVTPKCAIKYTRNLPDFFSSSPTCPQTLSFHCHCTSYLTCQIIPYIYAPVILIFHPFSKTTTDRTCLKYSGDRRLAHNIGIEQAQAGLDLFHCVNYSHSATDRMELWCYRTEMWWRCSCQCEQLRLITYKAYSKRDRTF
jgi:hypothetical protein